MVEFLNHKMIKIRIGSLMIKLVSSRINPIILHYVMTMCTKWVLVKTTIYIVYTLDILKFYDK
jgi:hypothetical protein